MIRDSREIVSPVSMSRTVVDLVSGLTDRSPLNLSPLECTIDTAAVDELFRPPQSDVTNGLTMSFDYEGHRITIHEDRTVEAEPLSDV